MKVTLLKKEEVEFNLAEEKCEKLSHNTFRMLTGYKETLHEGCFGPKMVVFKTKEEYQAEAWKYDLDLTKDVLINTKGNIFCYLKESKRTLTKSQPEDINEQNTNDAPANTEENKGEQA